MSIGSTVPQPPAAIQWLGLDHPALRPEGLPWFDRHGGELFRYPPEYRQVLAGERWWVWRLSTHPSGARLRFRTDSSQLRLRVETWHDALPGNNLHELARRGFELHVDGSFATNLVPASLGVEELLLYWEPASDCLRELTVWLPFWNPARVHGVGIDAGASIEPAVPHRVALPLVTVGSSITQGASASRASMIWPAQLARRLDAPLVNLGATGITVLGPELADLVCQIDASAYVLKLAITAWREPDAYRRELPRFLDQLRARQPRTPVVLLGPLAGARHWQQVERRGFLDGVRRVNAELHEVSAKRRSAGDLHLHAVDGFSLLGPQETDGLTDAVHPNDLGFYRMAERLAPTVARIVTPDE